LIHFIRPRLGAYTPPSFPVPSYLWSRVVFPAPPFRVLVMGGAAPAPVPPRMPLVPKAAVTRRPVLVPKPACLMSDRHQVEISPGPCIKGPRTFESLRRGRGGRETNPRLRQELRSSVASPTGESIATVTACGLRWNLRQARKSRYAPLRAFP